MQSFNYKVCSRCGMTSKWVNVAALCPRCQGELANAPAIAQARHEHRERVDAMSGNVEQLATEDALRRAEIEAGVPELAGIEQQLAVIRQALLEDRHDDAMSAWVVIHQLTSHFVATSGSW